MDHIAPLAELAGGVLPVVAAASSAWNSSARARKLGYWSNDANAGLHSTASPGSAAASAFASASRSVVDTVVGRALPIYAASGAAAAPNRCADAMCGTTAAATVA